MSNVMNLKQIRKSAGWGQKRLGDFLGVDASTISRVESGKVIPSGPLTKMIDLWVEQHGAAGTQTENCGAAQ